MLGFLGYLFLVFGFFKVLADFGLSQALAFAVLWFLFGILMLGIPSIVGILRTIGTFKSKELVSGLLAQLVLVAVLYGLLSLLGLSSVFAWFVVGGVALGLLAPKQALLMDRKDRGLTN